MTGIRSGTTALLGVSLVMSFLTGKARAQSVEVTSLPPAVERDGITGAGRAVVISTGDSREVILHYPNHPDDFGGSTGTGTALSSNDGEIWEAGTDNWPLPGMVDLWQDRLRNRDLIAFGIHWAPDPKKRGEITAADVPGDAYLVGFSKNGREWKTEPAVIECPPEFGVIARPLPHIFEGGDGVLFMPAYAWGKSGNRALLLESRDGGRRWSVRSVVTSAAAMVKAGAAVTTPWLETIVSPASDGSWLAVVRTGSNEQAGLMTSRSTDEGLTWSPIAKVIAGPDRQIVAGKLPGLILMPNRMLVLITAHTKLGCFIHLSPDGTGREWSAGHLITKLTGGNTSMVALDENRLLVFTPANGRINCWRVILGKTAQ